MRSAAPSTQKPPEAATLTLAQARGLWWKKQGLAGTTKGSLAGVLAASGWLRTLGGIDIYIAARARRPTMKRADLDAVVASGELRVVPAARGCIYAVPSAAVGDLMVLNAEGWRTQTEKELAKVGSSLKAIEAMAKPVLAALASAMTTDALRKALPAGSIPSFGEAGKKVGLSSPLPLVLRLLEFDGRIERTLEGGRLDNERYLWRKAEWKVPAAAKTAAARLANVVGAFLDFAGPSTIKHLAAWSGRAQRDLEPILEELAVPVTIEGIGAAWARSADVKAGKQTPPPSGLAALAFEDNYLVNHGGLAAVTDPRHHGISIDIWGGSKPEPIGKAAHVLSRTLVADGIVIGYWEVDPCARAGVWHTFDPAPKPLAAKLDELVGDTARFVLDELGHARSYTLDSMERVQERADRITKLASPKRKR